MAGNAPQGLLSIDGIDSYASVSFTFNTGVAPSVCNVVAPIIDQKIPHVSDLTLQFDRTKIVFPDCSVVSANYSRRQGGNLWNIQIFDRRWRWRFGEISGWYNTQLPNGDIQDGREETPRELMTLLLKAMGEQQISVATVPNTERPEVAWESANPAAELQRLCDLLKCRVVLKLDDSVAVVPIGPGAEIPNNLPLIDTANPFRHAVRPDRIKLVGGPTLFQQALDLVPVGLDVDGTIKLIDKLSYKPAAGWTPASDILKFGQITGTFVDPVDGKEKEKRSLAVQSVFRWYQVDVDTVDQLFGGTFEKLSRIAPIRSTLLQNREGADGTLTPKPAIITGTFWPGDTTPAADAQQDVGPDAPYEEGFSIDAVNCVVKFGRPVTKFDGTLPTLKLTTSFQLFEDDGSTIRMTKAQNQPGNRRHTKDMIIRRDDLFHRAIDGIWKPELNRQVDKQADAALADAARQFALEGAEDVQAAGIHKLDLDGAIQQITWTIGGGGAFTRISRAWNHNQQMGAADRNAVAARQVARDRGEN